MASQSCIEALRLGMITHQIIDRSGSAVESGANEYRSKGRNGGNQEAYQGKDLLTSRTHSLPEKLYSLITSHRTRQTDRIRKDLSRILPVSANYHRKRPMLLSAVFPLVNERRV